MAGKLVDDGTLDTVIACDRCGERERFHYDSQNYDADLDEAEWIQECIDMFEDNHECPPESIPDPEPEKDMDGTYYHNPMDEASEEDFEKWAVNAPEAETPPTSYWKEWLDGLEDAGEGGKQEHIAFWVRRVVESFSADYDALAKRLDTVTKERDEARLALGEAAREINVEAYDDLNGAPEDEEDR